MHIIYGISEVVKSSARLIAGLLSIAGLLALMVFMTCSSSISVASDYHSNYEKIPAVNKKPLRVGQWSLTPTLIVCEYAPVSKAHALSAVAYWKKLGHRFYSIQYKHDPLNKCTSASPVGYIIIHLVSQDIKLEESSLAETHFFVDNSTNNIEWARIYMRSDVRATVLEHEIGHALGFLHYDKINHIMNSKWPQGGWDTDGLNNN